ncbi:MAG: hypothetical protein IKL07_02745, partial [Clostridium sp.]|nr:hypothetical protein [Clostridium sp.]
MDGQLSFEFEQRKPIKGYPELHWTGKRPYTSTQYYPAQLKESFGKPKDGWMNKIFWGDNLQVMSHLLKEFRGKVDLIYIDPPFDSKADYKKKIELRGKKKIFSDTSSFEEKQYGDIWVNDEYLQFIYQRLILIKELLSERGTVYVHCDWHKSQYIRCILDEVFGGDNLLNEVVWYYRRWTAASNTFQKMHDTIFVYSKTKDYIFNPVYIDATEGQQKKHDKGYDRNSVMIDGERKPQLLVYDKQKVDDAVAQGIIDLSEFARIVEVKASGTIAHDVWKIDKANDFYEVYTMRDEKEMSDVWEINYINSQAVERTNYPTQKPEELLERILLASTTEDSIVFDCFMGSGTTQAVAMKMGRRFLGADINIGAIQTATKRLLGLCSNTENACGFEVYNVNNYDFFRNPLEAKELIIDALGIQRYDSSSAYDGELDGWMVKIMPANRIATKADLEELKANLPYRTFEKRKEENPNCVVEKIRIICMGHEADLKASLEQELSAYKLEIEILDILRDKTDLQFKREADANVVKEGNMVVVKEFYPMNLLQKLSMQKESVEDWRQLVESIYIDWNYDGETMRPAVCDIPGKDELVSGVYEIPASATRIKIKITDLLS